VDSVHVALAIGGTEDVLLPLGEISGMTLSSGEAVIWSRRDRSLNRFTILPGRLERQHHMRKYAAGDLGDHALHFRGKDGRLNLRAQNLAMFIQIADGVDEETWLYHLRHGDYSDWFK